MNDGVATISVVARALHLAESPLPTEIAEQVKTFLKAAHWHHRRLPDQTVPAWIKQVYDWGMSATCGIEPGTAILDSISDRLRAATAIFQPLLERVAELDRLVAHQYTAIQALETTRTSWEDERRRLYDEQHALHEERRTLHDERGTLYGERVTFRDERQALHAERLTLHDERSRLNAERAELLAAREVLSQTLLQTEQAKRIILNSTSWRVTAPLRSLKRLARGRSGSDGTA